MGHELQRIITPRGTAKLLGVNVSTRDAYHLPGGGEWQQLFFFIAVDIYSGFGLAVSGPFSLSID